MWARDDVLKWQIDIQFITQFSHREAKKPECSHIQEAEIWEFWHFISQRMIQTDQSIQLIVKLTKNIFNKIFNGCSCEQVLAWNTSQNLCLIHHKGKSGL